MAVFTELGYKCDSNSR